MTTEQIRAMRLTKVLDGIVIFGCLVLFISSLALMVSSAISNPDPIVTNLYLGLLGSLLLVSASTAAGIIGYSKPLPIVWGVIRSRLIKLRSKVVEATDWSFLSPDPLLLTSGKGEISKLITVSPIQLTIPPKPKLPQAVDLGPGFIYVMRRADGIYKLGRAMGARLQRLLKRCFWVVYRRYFPRQSEVTMDRLCNDCGNSFPDTGDDQCPHCGSTDTFVPDYDVDFESEEE